MPDEMITIAWKMKNKICSFRLCNDCPLDIRRHPFPIVSSLCVMNKELLTEEMIQYIDAWYHKLIHDGELVLPQQVNISAEDILEVFK